MRLARFFVLFAILGLTLTTASSARAAEADVPTAMAKITVKLPPDALLLVDGQHTSSEGATRVFTSPPLALGFPFVYEFRGYVLRGRQWIEAVERVVVWGGEESKVTLFLPLVSEPVGKPKGKGPDGGPKKDMKKDGKSE